MILPALLASAAPAAPGPDGQAPSAPWDVTASPGTGNITLSWKEPLYSNASAVEEYRITYGGSPAFMLNSATTTELAYVLDGLTAGKPCYLKVAARNSAGWGADSEVVSATPYGPPSAPLAFTAFATRTSVLLNWSAPTYAGPGGLVFHLFRNGVLIWSAGTMEYNDTSVLPGGHYSYSVAAQNQAGWGENSTLIDVVVAVPPGIPQDLRITSGEGSVTLEWTPPALTGTARIVGYEVFRKGSSGGFAYLATVAGTNFTDTGLRSGTTYHYKVCAMSSAGLGNLTREVTAAPLATAAERSATLTAVALAVVAAAAVIGVALFLLMRRRAR